jgi:hypothetical protein
MAGLLVFPEVQHLRLRLLRRAGRQAFGDGHVVEIFGGQQWHFQVDVGIDGRYEKRNRANLRFARGGEDEEAGLDGGEFFPLEPAWRSMEVRRGRGSGLLSQQSGTTKHQRQDTTPHTTRIMPQTNNGGNGPAELHSLTGRPGFVGTLLALPARQKGL